MGQRLKNVRFSIRYVVFVFLILVFTDVFIFKKILNLGYSTNYSESNIERFPHPYYEFAGKPNTLNHNALGFKGEIFTESDLRDTSLLKIAFFGGSTGYMGQPPIAEIIQSQISSWTGRRVKVMNYSAISSNHRQHIHCMVEYLTKYPPDIVVFYGGYNETFQPTAYDPRPGYPYNYYFRAELSTFKKLLIENSAIVGTIDRKNEGVISGLKHLRDSTGVLSDEWSQNIIQNYFETLGIAERLSKVLCSQKYPTKFYAFYQPYQVPQKFVKNHLKIKSLVNSNSFFHDYSDILDDVKDTAYTDIVHVKQFANEIIARNMASTLLAELKQPRTNL